MKPPSSEPERLLRVDDVAERLSLPKRSVWSLIAAGKIRAIKLSSRRTRVPESELNRYIAELKKRSGLG